MHSVVDDIFSRGSCAASGIWFGREKGVDVVIWRARVGDTI